MDKENTDIQVSNIYLDGQYKSKNSDWHVADSPWKASQIKKLIEKNNLNLTNICEVGCGAGEILRQLSLRMPTAKFYGYEVSTDAFELCRERESERIKFYLQDILKEDTKFDAILCIDVFEHVDNYMGFLRKLRCKAEYKIFHIPLDLSVTSLLRGSMLKTRESLGHLHYFTPDTALATLRDCGYEVLDHMYTPTFANSESLKTLKAKVARGPRAILYGISPKLMSTLLGGCSLMVLAR